MKKTPVIFDTDIGGDIDDIWAVAFSHIGVQSCEMKISVTDKGMTIPSENGANIHVAKEWIDKDYFLDLLVDTFCE